MILLNPDKTTGKQVHKVIMTVISDRTKSIRHNVTKADFCRESGISKATLHRFRKGAKPSANALVKIGKGLTAWGFETKIEFSNE